MPRPEPRSPEQRKSDVLALLSAPAADAWVATAGDGPYLVPLSLHWTGQLIVLALEASSRTARNLDASRAARLALGGSRDVVMIDASVTDLLPAATAPDEIAASYAEQSDWDPRTAGGAYVYTVLQPTRVQAWREASEIRGRTLMRDGAWIV